MNPKKLYILMGLKGSGKSYIGQLMEELFGFKFLLVEPIFIKAQKENGNNNGFQEVIDEIKYLFEQNQNIVIETTGASDHTKLYFEKLTNSYDIILIRIDAPLDLCKKRVINRSKENHLIISNDSIDTINKISIEKRNDYQYDLIIENSGSGKEKIQEILNAFLKK